MKKWYSTSRVNGGVLHDRVTAENQTEENGRGLHATQVQHGEVRKQLNLRISPHGRTGLACFDGIGMLRSFALISMKTSNA